jgi:urease accessory protein
VRTTTDGDTEIGIVVDEKSELESGDVLVLNDDRMIVVKFETREAMVIKYPEPESFDDVASVAKLGHVIGNHHWDLQIRDGAFYIPLSDARRIMESVVKDVLPSDAVIRYERMDSSVFTDLPHQHHHHEGDEYDR